VDDGAAEFVRHEASVTERVIRLEAHKAAAIGLKDHVTALVDKAHLVRHGAGRGTWYALS
jgi:hypothetical protein